MKTLAPNLNDTEILSAPLELKNGTKIKNRFFKSAMSESLGDNKNNPTEELARLYQAWAEGGAGLIITGNVMIHPDHLGEPRNVVLEANKDLEIYKRCAQAGTLNDTHLWVQLNHPGKQIPNFLNNEPVAPSAIPFPGRLGKMFNAPRELTGAEILDIIERFGVSAALSREAGYTGVQIHGAHGYLVSQFLSPRHNRRSDEWGGSPENRRRFALEVYQSIRKNVGDDFPIGIKLNSADFQKGGFTEDESLDVIDALSKDGIDLLEISGGTYENPEMMKSTQQKESTIKREAFFLEFAEKVRKRTDLPLVVTGGFRTASGMAAALRSGATDMIGLARPLAVEPDLCNRLMAGADAATPIKSLKTGVKAVDEMGLLNIMWFARQLERIGKGQKPDPNLGLWSTLTKVMLTQGFQGFQKKRA